MKYRKKPVVIDAWLTSDLVTLATEDWDNLPACIRHGSRDGTLVFSLAQRVVDIRTREGVMTADRDDMIIRGVAGELYPCKPDIFRATYDAVWEEDE